MTSHSPKQNKPNVNKPETVPAPPAPIWGEIQESWGLLSDSRVPMLVKLVPGLIVIGYFIFPVDLIPDPILAIGQVDDMGVLLAGLMTFRHIAANYVGPTTLQPQPSSTTKRTPSSSAAGSDSEADWVDAEWYESKPYLLQPVPPKRRGYLTIIGTVVATAILLLLTLGAVRASQCKDGSAISHIPGEVLGVLSGKPPQCLSIPPEIIIGRLEGKKLHIVNYVTQKVLEERREDCIAGPEQLLYIAKGGAFIGTDLGKLTLNDIQITDNGTRVSLKLPPAEPLHSYLDVEDSRVVDYRKPAVCPNHKLDMVVDAQRKAKDEIQFSAESEQMLKIADEYSQGFMELFLLKLGFPEVEVTINSPREEKDPSQPAPVVPDGSEAPVSPAPEATPPPAPVSEVATP